MRGDITIPKTHQKTSYRTRYVYKNYLLRMRFCARLAAMMDEIKQITSLLRARHGFSQAQIARLLGIPPKTFGDWLGGRTRCRHQRMLLLALEAVTARMQITKG